jgi:hypothetical protein
MVIDNKKDIINGFEMKAITGIIAGDIEISYMSDGRKVETEKYEAFADAIDEVKDVLMEDTIHNLNVEQEEYVISLEDIKEHIRYVISR